MFTTKKFRIRLPFTNNNIVDIELYYFIGYGTVGGGGIIVVGYGNYVAVIAAVGYEATAAGGDSIVCC